MEPDAILIRNALLIDGVRKEPIEGVSVLIENKRIKEIGKSIIPPEGSEIIEAEGETVMPGMIDCHVHLVLDGEPNYPDPNFTLDVSFETATGGAAKTPAVDAKWVTVNSDKNRPTALFTPATRTSAHAPFQP